MKFIEFGKFLEINNIKNKDAAKNLGVKPPMISQWRHDPRIKIEMNTGDLVRVSIISRNVKCKLQAS